MPRYVSDETMQRINAEVDEAMVEILAIIEEASAKECGAAFLKGHSAIDKARADWRRAVESTRARIRADLVRILIEEGE